MNEERIKRNLDGAFFRVKRGNKYDAICFSDLTEVEMREVLANWSASTLINMCVMLGKRIREIGDDLDIVREL